ncbi:hypothetical protein AMIS_29830 [Actinoplanes missouriensis 431]|uniref:Uncharacterized protein n=1 Tax=Actinoplanes missouriensis (strain ATCC 14538 / DSM 43046 / CBS 188.64 / JCM 3121 / NBRC 102363 / NCIMB 12654 / NRRL B-3342 / UNCC 431) TaxID=512565 RepID=I0H5B6_ACTM4|nr:hypothetical protein [Actinoplanes missouriensis]BAL88203.1 hypothetical protein AMIS_29830 [Actinoplanes missouriensis 431]
MDNRARKRLVRPVPPRAAAGGIAVPHESPAGRMPLGPAGLTTTVGRWQTFVTTNVTDGPPLPVDVAYLDGVPQRSGHQQEHCTTSPALRDSRW